MSGFALLLAFALFKMALGAIVIYLGLRGGESAGPDDGFEPLAPEPPPAPPARRRRKRTRARGGPDRSPARVGSRGRVRR